MERIVERELRIVGRPRRNTRGRPAEAVRGPHERDGRIGARGEPLVPIAVARGRDDLGAGPGPAVDLPIANRDFDRRLLHLRLHAEGDREAGRRCRGDPDLRRCGVAADEGALPSRRPSSRTGHRFSRFHPRRPIPARRIRTVPIRQNKASMSPAPDGRGPAGSRDGCRERRTADRSRPRTCFPRRGSSDGRSTSGTTYARAAPPVRRTVIATASVGEQRHGNMAGPASRRHRGSRTGTSRPAARSPRAG